MKAYGYYTCIKDEMMDEYISDRGIVFADSISIAIEKLRKHSETSDEKIIHVEVYEIEQPETDVYSSFFLFSNTNVGKDELKYELSEWSLI